MPNEDATNQYAMEFKLVVPTKIVVDDRAVKISAEGLDGAFTVLPRHIDFVSVLAPGLLAYETPDGRKQFLAVDSGAFVKQGRRVIVSAYTAVRHEDLDRLKDAVASFFEDADEREKKTRTALARIEADLVTRLSGLEDTSQ